MQFVEGTGKKYLTRFSHLDAVPLPNSRKINDVLVACRAVLPEDIGVVTFHRGVQVVVVGGNTQVLEVPMSVLVSGLVGNQGDLTLGWSAILLIITKCLNITVGLAGSFCVLEVILTDTTVSRSSKHFCN